MKDQLEMIKVSETEGLHQYPYQNYGSKWLASRKRALLADEMGLGKGSPVGTNVLTPYGWAPIETLRLGDLITSSDGAFTRITGLYNRGILPVYKVTFNDGASVKVDGDHLWAVKNGNDLMRNRSYRIIQTRDMIGDLQDKSGNNRWRIPMVKPVEFLTSIDLPIAPYILGVLLGDGSLTQNSISFCPGDSLVPLEVAKELPEDLFMSARPDCVNHAQSWSINSGMGSRSNHYLDSLRQLGLMGKLSYEKFIPEEYLLTDIEDRLALLQGLMDTDGSQTKSDGHLEFSSSSLDLVEGVEFLVGSLGGQTRSIKAKSTHYKKKGIRVDCREHYRISIKTPIGMCPFRAHADHYVEKTKYPPSRLMVSIEPAGEAEVICLAVDALDKLYVTENFIVTHNTNQAIIALRYLRSDVNLVICPNSLKENWKKELKKWWPRAPVTIVRGNTLEKCSQVITFERGFLIANYECFRSDGYVKIDPEKEPLFYCLAHKSWKSIIIDEAHRVKNETTQQFRGVSRVCKGDKNVFMLSGTPIMNRVTELWAQLHIINPDLWANKFDFIRNHTYYYVNGDTKKCRDPEKLQKEIGHVFLRRLKEDIRKDIPEKTYQQIWIELTPAQRLLYAQMEDEMFVEAQSMYNSYTSRGMGVEQAKALVATCILTQMLRLKQCCINPMLMDEKFDPTEKLKNYGPKLEALMDIIDGTGEKIFIVSQFEKVIRLISTMLNGRGIYHKQYTGKFNERQRHENLEEFRNNSDCQILLATTQAGGEGIDITEASIIVFCDKMWTPAANEQAVARLHRHGQTKPVTIIELLAEDTIENTIEGTLDLKEMIIKQVIGNSDRKVVDSRIKEPQEVY